MFEAVQRSFVVVLFQRNKWNSLSVLNQVQRVYDLKALAVDFWSICKRSALALANFPLGHLERGDSNRLFIELPSKLISFLFVCPPVSLLMNIDTCHLVYIRRRVLECTWRRRRRRVCLSVTRRLFARFLFFLFCFVRPSFDSLFLLLKSLWLRLSSCLCVCVCVCLRSTHNRIE